MIVETHLITFGGSAVQFPAPTANSSSGLVRRVYAEPLRSNAAVSFVGTAAVTNDGSGTGVVRELAAPSGTTALDYFDDNDQMGQNRIDPLQWYAHGTSTQKLKVTYEIG